MSSPVKSRRLSSKRLSVLPMGRKGTDAGMSATMVSQMYAKILKMSTENKITTKNTWSLPLIDHMEEILNEDMNFQKASCAIDASVQIYSSRVDDVWTSSYRVLENLNRSDARPTDVEAETQKGVSKRLGAVETLETNLANITVKKFDMECDVDPMFHKMSKNFDEGGAKGLLLNQLGVQEGCRLAFDSIDVADVDSLATAAAIIGPDFMDCSEFASRLAGLAELHLCPQLECVYAKLEGRGEAPSALPPAHDATFYDDTLLVTSACSESVSVPCGDSKAHGSVGVASVAGDRISGGSGTLLGDISVYGGDDGSVGGGGDEGDDGYGDEGEEVEAAGPSAAIVQAQNILDGEGLEFVDARMLKDFLAPAVKQREREDKRKKKAAEATKKKTTTKGKKTAEPKAKKAGPVFVDFTAPPPDDSCFAPPPKAPKSMLLTDAALRRAEAEGPGAFLIPEGEAVEDDAPAEDAVGAAGAARMSVGGMGGGDDSDDDGGMCGLATPTHVPDTDAIAWANDYSFDFNGSFVPQPDKVDPTGIKYARVAKQVDVQKLKVDMWSYVSSHPAEGPAKVIPVAGCRDATLTGAGDGLSFQSLISTLAPDEPADVTTPFYFICMLHLANDHGLTLQGAPGLRDITIFQNQ